MDLYVALEFIHTVGFMLPVPPGLSSTQPAPLPPMVPLGNAKPVVSGSPAVVGEGAASLIRGSPPLRLGSPAFTRPAPAPLAPACKKPPCVPAQPGEALGGRSDPRRGALGGRSGHQRSTATRAPARETREARPPRNDKDHVQDTEDTVLASR